MTEAGVFKILLKQETNREYNFDFPIHQTETVHVIAKKLTEVIYESYKRKSCVSRDKRHQTLEFINNICEVPEPHTYDNYMECAYKQIRYACDTIEGNDVVNINKKITSDIEKYQNNLFQKNVTEHYSRKIKKEKENAKKRELIDENIQEKLREKYHLEVRKKYSFELNENLLKRILGTKTDLNASVNICDDENVCDRENIVKLGYTMLNLGEINILKKILQRISSINALNKLESNFLQYIWLLHFDDLHVLIGENPDIFYFLMEQTLLKHATCLLELKHRQEIGQYLLELENDCKILKIRRVCEHNINCYLKLKSLLYELHCISFCNVNILKLCDIISIQECNPKLNTKYTHHKPLRATEGKVASSKIDNDITRELIVTDRAASKTSAILPRTEFDRLRKQAKVMTLQDKIEMIEEAERQKNQIQQESADRKDQLSKALKIQKAIPGKKLDLVESEAAEKNLYLIKRSEELMIEQNDKVKQVNRIILATKCRAIRNAQISEKKLIEKQLQEENKRLDSMMEQIRREHILEDAKRRAEAVRKKQRYIKEVEQQVRENEMYQLLEAEKIEEESRMMNKALTTWRKEEDSKLMEKRNIQLRLRDALERAYEESELYKSIKEEEDRISDMRIADFMRIKREREEALENEKALIKLVKEREIVRMTENQAKSQDIKAAMDKLNAVRAQEEKEKEWREKEKEEAIKRQKAIEDLKKSRAKQVEDIRKAQAVALARDEESFMKVLTRQKMLLDVEIKKQQQRKYDSEKHRKYLIKQINEKEKIRNQYQKEKFVGSKVQRQEFDVEDQRVEEYLQRKVDKLREIHIPETYIRDIERQMEFIK